MMTLSNSVLNDDPVGRCNNGIRKMGIERMTDYGLDGWTADIKKCIKQIDNERLWLAKEKDRLNKVLKEIRVEKARRLAENGEP